ncbi:hypothetical protein GGQ65_004355 [Rhizobium fabae]|uniref:Uncharacterized protein n=1 Tax=Rhizobium fabae TaxID=573179 RepID=A0A7W6FKD9_9HYPH|nr:hypothetical protein [Rhizobium fabae]
MNHGLRSLLRVHLGTAFQSALPPVSLKGPTAHDFQLEKTMC